MIIVSHFDYERATSRQLIDLKCEYCGKIFQKRKKDITNNKRENSHAQVNFCSTKCLMLFKGKQNRNRSRIETTCGWCGKEISVPRSVLLSSKSGKVFCSISCGTKYSNVNANRNKYEKISKILKEKAENTRIYLICKHCGKQYKKNSKNKHFCSIECYKEYIHEHKKPKISKPKISKPKNPNVHKPKVSRPKISRTKEWCAETVKNLRMNGVIPTVRTVPALTHASKNLFGGWNKMMIELGYTDVFVGPKRKLKSKDGHHCDSASEVLIDNFLFENSIQHERSKLYPNSKKNCDFYLNEFNVWLEFAGLYGYDYYDKTMKEKEEIAKNSNLNLIIITKQELYKKGSKNAKTFLKTLFETKGLIAK